MHWIPQHNTLYTNLSFGTYLNFLAADWTVSLCYLPILLAIQRKLHQIRFSTSSARPSEQLDIVYAEVNSSSSGAL